jgi:hypothetical protein
VSIQIPPEASLGVQRALKELDDRMYRLERDMNSTATRDDLVVAMSQVTTGLPRKTRSLDFNDVVRGGPAHALGHAPDPGPGTAVTEYLSSDGEFAPLLDGAIVSPDPGSAGTSLAQKVVEVHGSLAVLSALSAETVRSRNSLVTNSLYAGLERIDGVQPWCVGYSSGQFAGTTETEMTSYGYTIPLNTLAAGDTAIVFGEWALGGVTAGTKAATLYIGSSAGVTLFSSASTTLNTLFIFILHFTVRSSTSIAVTGICTEGVKDGASTIYTVNAAQTVDLTANQLVKLTGSHSGANNELKMTDFSIKFFRSGGRFQLV